MLDNMNESSSNSSGESAKSPKKTIGRSEIAFPYVSLEDAVGVARAIHDNGASLSRGQIEGYLNMKSAQLRIGAARLFGLIAEISDGKFALTDLGISIVSSDESEARAARRDAFLNAPLYHKTFETFKTRNLPVRPHGLEAAFVEFGVAPKQKDKARQAFERSASFAGFFDVNKDRLVEPIISRNPISEAVRQWHDENSTHNSKLEAEKKDVSASPADDFLIKGLLDRLPPTNQKWSADDRARWLRAFSVNLGMIYGDESDTREIEITVPDKLTKAGALLRDITKNE